MHDTGCLGLVHWDDPEGWYGEGGGRRVQDGEHIFPVLRCMSCLYILEIKYLSAVLFAIIFFHSEGCLFTLLFLCCTKAFKFN